MGKRYDIQWDDVWDCWAKKVKLTLNLRKLTEEESRVVSERTKICHECPFRKGYVCGECGCIIPVKVLSKKQKCKRWPH